MNKLSSQDKSKLDGFNSMSVGEIFKKTRLKNGYEIAQLVEHLNIGSEHLEAIENNDEAHLPPKVYAIGFVRAYADALGLDSEKMVYLFKVQVYGKKQLEDKKEIVKTDGKSVSFIDIISNKKEAVLVIVALLILIGLIISILWVLVMWIITPSDNNKITVPPVPADMLAQLNADQDGFVESEAISVSEPMDLIIRPDDGATAYGVDALESAMAFRFLAETDLQVQSVTDGNVMISQTMKAGDVFYISQDQDILLSTKNAGAIEAHLDNQPLGRLGNDGEAIRLRPFSVKALRLQRGE